MTARELIGLYDSLIATEKKWLVSLTRPEIIKEAQDKIASYQTRVQELKLEALETGEVTEDEYRAWVQN